MRFNYNNTHLSARMYRNRAENREASRRFNNIWFSSRNVVNHRSQRTPRAARTCERSRPPPADQAWNTDLPGGRKLWFRLVIAFTTVCLFGIGLVTLGAIFIGQAHQMHSEGQTTLPLTWCIIGIVSGSLLIMGSVLLGRVMISSKWRKNEQPTYPSAAPQQTTTQVRFVSEDESTLSRSEEDLPPPYSGPLEARGDFMTSSFPVILTVPGRNIAVTLPPPDQPSTYLPGYSDVSGPLPDYEEVIKAKESDKSDPEVQLEGGKETGGKTRIKVLTVVTASRGDPPPYEPWDSSQTNTDIVSASPDQGASSSTPGLNIPL